MRSLRARLVLAVALGTAGLLVLANAAVYVGFRHALLVTFDRALEANAEALRPLLEMEGRGPVEFERDLEDWPEFLRRGEASVRITDGRGAVVFERGAMPPLHGPPRRFLTVPGPEHPLRLLRQVVRVEAGGPPALRPPPAEVQLVLARPLGPVMRQLDALGLVLAAVALGGSLVAAAMAYVVARVGLRPVDRLAQQIAAIAPDRLDTQLDDSALPAELQPVAGQLNALMRRLDVAMLRERGFTADAAHELRTPLAGLRTAAEVSLQREDRPAEQYRRTVEQSLQIVTVLQDMVDRLLMLARLDARQGPRDLQPTRLLPLVHRALELHRDTASTDERTVEVEVDPQDAWMADPGLAQVVVQNLLGNAMVHADAGTPVQVRTEPAEDALRLIVRNRAGGIHDPDLPMLFERFWRGTTAREQEAGHAGLGLALVQRAVQVMDGTVQARMPEPGVLELRVTLPGA